VSDSYIYVYVYAYTKCPYDYMSNSQTYLEYFVEKDEVRK